MNPVPMRHQNWGPPGQTGAVSGVGGTSGALQQATAQPAPMPTPYPAQNNAPMAPQTRPMPANTGIVPPQMQQPQPHSAMMRPAAMPQMGALQSWFSQQMPMWQQAQMQTMQRPMPQMPQQFQQGMQQFNSYMPFGGLNMFSSWR